MKKKSVHVNIYNFIRMSHTEPTRFIQDDFDTIQEQIVTMKQYGFSGTYALKYDALMEPRYQELLKEYLDDGDEISAWWEITREMCKRSGVRFRDSFQEEEYDDRVDSAYSIGYTPEERKLLVDGYMADFYSVFCKYPQSIGSWVLDSVTMEYAREKYGVEAFAICRDQIGVDGFTLWGGYPNGPYYPSKYNENVPAQNADHQIAAPVFRLLGPDPIYNFEAEVRDNLPGVYTLEPAWLTGRNKLWIQWLFDRLCKEDALGVGYAHVGQENNFLWENIRPGYAPQLDVVKKMQEQGLLRVETMAQTAKYFREKYALTPPMTFQASADWSERNLSCQWYASAAYRVGFLGENGHLRIRDMFLYDQNYQSRYLYCPMKQTKSVFDALPVLYPQLWKKHLGARPYIRFLDKEGNELSGEITYGSLDPLTAKAELNMDSGCLSCVMRPGCMEITGAEMMVFDALPVFEAANDNVISMRYEGFGYTLRIAQGKVLVAGKNGVRIAAESGRIILELGAEASRQDIFTEEYLQNPTTIDDRPVAYPVPKLQIPPFAPEMIPADSVFPWGSREEVKLVAREEGTIFYTLDGSAPNKQSEVYTKPLILDRDTIVRAIFVTADGKCSKETMCVYRFALKNMMMESPTKLDSREVFFGSGMKDLLKQQRATCDYLDGQWRGTLEDIDITCSFPETRDIASIHMGFLTHHRSGIVYPEKLELYIGSDKDHLVLYDAIQLPDGPDVREIVKRDFGFEVHKPIGAFRFVARRYERMPQWCTYRGTPTVFTMADNLIVVPE